MLLSIYNNDKLLRRPKNNCNFPFKNWESLDLGDQFQTNENYNARSEIIWSLKKLVSSKALKDIPNIFCIL